MYGFTNDCDKDDRSANKYLGCHSILARRRAYDSVTQKSTHTGASSSQLVWGLLVLLHHSVLIQHGLASCRLHWKHALELVMVLLCGLKAPEYFLSCVFLHCRVVEEHSLRCKWHRDEPVTICMRGLIPAASPHTRRGGRWGLRGSCRMLVQQPCILLRGVMVEASHRLEFLLLQQRVKDKIHGRFQMSCWDLHLPVWNLQSTVTTRV